MIFIITLALIGTVTAALLWAGYYWSCLHLLAGFGLGYLLLLQPTAAVTGTLLYVIVLAVHYLRKRSFREQVRPHLTPWLQRPVITVMRPREDVVTLEKSELNNALEIIRKHDYSRYPVVDSGGDVVGSLTLRDIMTPPFQLRTPLFVPAGKSIGDTLELMKKGSSHLAIIVDEYGDWQGIVTLEDILEELVGDIRDESDSGEQNLRLIRRYEEHSWLIDCSCPWYDLITVLSRKDVVFPSEWAEPRRYNTVAGHILTVAQRIPEEGDRVRDGEWSWFIVSRSGSKIEEAILHPRQVSPVAGKEQG
jgi:putative hemolysin